jgi:hypothetical protein
MEKTGDVRPDRTPDLAEKPSDDKRAAAKTAEQLTTQDPVRRVAEALIDHVGPTHVLSDR